ncbi:MAG: hypothetical protein VZR29_04585 [Lachnospiraceae bacterium]|nr:hypothetical protein [Lachnospiraceae bacterium]
MTKKELKEKEKALLHQLEEVAKKDNIPFRTILESYLTEAVICRIDETSIGDSMFLMNDSVLGNEILPPQKKLIYTEAENSRIRPKDGFVAGQSLSQTFLEDLWKCIADELLAIGFHLEQGEDWISYSEDCGMLNLKISLLDIRTSFSIEIRRGKKEDLYPVRRSKKKFLCEEEYSYNHYPIEEEAALHMAEILNKLELLQDMEEYYSLYRILKEEPLEGRRVQDLFQNAWKDTFREETKDFFISYGDYPFMRKKWNRVMKKYPRAEDWKTTHALIAAFILPIWDSTAQDQIFLDSWMPALGRYLE